MVSVAALQRALRPAIEFERYPEVRIAQWRELLRVPTLNALHARAEVVKKLESFDGHSLLLEYLGEESSPDLVLRLDERLRIASEPEGNHTTNLWHISSREAEKLLRDQLHASPEQRSVTAVPADPDLAYFRPELARALYPAGKTAAEKRERTQRDGGRYGGADGTRPKITRDLSGYAEPDLYEFFSYEDLRRLFGNDSERLWSLVERYPSMAQRVAPMLETTPEEMREFLEQRERDEGYPSDPAGLRVLLGFVRRYPGRATDVAAYLGMTPEAVRWHAYAARKSEELDRLVDPFREKVKSC